MKLFFAAILLLAGIEVAQAQTTAPAIEKPRLDSLTRLAQKYLNAQQPDSLYALMGDEFRKQIPLEQARQILSQLHSQLGEWKTSDQKELKDGVARYRATFANAPVDFYISRDKVGKIYTFMFHPAKD